MDNPDFSALMLSSLFSSEENQRGKKKFKAAAAVNDAFYDLSIHTFKVARQLGYALETSEMKSSQRGA